MSFKYLLIWSNKNNNVGITGNCSAVSLYHSLFMIMILLPFGNGHEDVAGPTTYIVKGLSLQINSPKLQVILNG